MNSLRWLAGVAIGAASVLSAVSASAPIWNVRDQSDPGCGSFATDYPDTTMEAIHAYYQSK